MQGRPPILNPANVPPQAPAPARPPANAPTPTKRSVDNMQLMMKETASCQAVVRRIRETKTHLNRLSEIATHLEGQANCPASADVVRIKTNVENFAHQLDQTSTKFQNAYAQSRWDRKGKIAQKVQAAPAAEKAATLREGHDTFNREDSEERAQLLKDLKNGLNAPTEVLIGNRQDEYGFSKTNIDEMQTVLDQEETATKATMEEAANGQNPQDLAANPAYQNAKTAHETAKKRKEDFEAAVQALHLKEDDDNKKIFANIEQALVADLDAYNREVQDVQNQNLAHATHAAFVESNLPRSAQAGMREEAFGDKEDHAPRSSKLDRSIGAFTKVSFDGKGMHFSKTKGPLGKIGSWFCESSDTTAMEKAKLIVEEAQKRGWNQINLRNMDRKTAAFVMQYQMECEQQHGYKPKDIYFYDEANKRGRCLRDADNARNGLPEDEISVDHAFLNSRSQANLLNGVLYPFSRICKLMGINSISVPNSIFSFKSKYAAKRASQENTAAERGIDTLMQAYSTANWYDNAESLGESSVKLLESSRYTKEQKADIAKRIKELRAEAMGSDRANPNAPDPFPNAKLADTKLDEYIAAGRPQRGQGPQQPGGGGGA